MFKTCTLFFCLWAFAHCSGVRTIFNSNHEGIDHAILKGSIPLMTKEMDDNIYSFLSNEFGDLMPDQIANSSTSDSGNFSSQMSGKILTKAFDFRRQFNPNDSSQKQIHI